MTYNPDYYRDGKMRMVRGNEEAIHTFATQDGTLIGMFQGNRGENLIAAEWMYHPYHFEMYQS